MVSNTNIIYYNYMQFRLDSMSSIKLHVDQSTFLGALYLMVEALSNSTESDYKTWQEIITLLHKNIKDL